MNQSWRASSTLGPDLGDDIQTLSLSLISYLDEVSGDSGRVKVYLIVEEM